MRTKVELLAPAGNRSKLNTAMYFGADAVYVGGKNFSLRSYADNFTENELRLATEYVHSAGKKIYVTTNIYARNSDFGELADYFTFLESIGVDAALISDGGVLSIAKSSAPGLKIHISTQANTTNKYAAKFWADEGASRVVLARELSVKEIAEIHEFVPDLELEAFVHGAMCISYSGRCLLSNYLTGRDSNRGECAQPCRWNYFVRKRDELSDSGWMNISEDERGTYIFNSKDLNMSEHLDALADAGVCSFKIEGRMKSEYYLATVINAYRRCMDNGYDKTVERELLTAAHREYTTAYAFKKNDETVNYDDSQARGDCDFIAVVVGSGDGFVCAEMRSRFMVGDVLEILSPGENFGKSFTVGKVYLEDGTAVEDCKLVQATYKVDCPYKLSPGDILRRRIKREENIDVADRS